MNYLITIYKGKTGFSGSAEVKLFKDMSLEDALAAATKKGQIVEVWRTDNKGNPLEEVAWQHLYHF